MNRIHEANRRLWDRDVQEWEERCNRAGRWHQCHESPELAFEGGALELIRAVVGDLRHKEACVIGSGDNMAAYALAGLGARVTSTDISEQRLERAALRAEELGLPITFLRADAADLRELDDSSFDLVCSTNGFFVWIADVPGVFREVARILRPGGAYVFFDIHPFQRPWKEQVSPIEMAKPYWDTGPFVHGEGDSYEHNWTLADLLNPLADAGLTLVEIREAPAEAAHFWREDARQSEGDADLLDWRANPRAGLPVWLSVAAVSP